jgi:uncharacterized membrane protein
MAAFFQNLRNVVIAGFVLALLLYILGWSRTNFDNYVVLQFLLRWLHVVSGVMWIGLLWYFNFVSTPTTPKIPAELRPALGRYITPAALFWFRWAAMATFILGLCLAWANGYFLQMVTLDAVDPSGTPFSTAAFINIGIGAWFGTIMWFNVWFIIWPNQQKALNINNRYPDLQQPAKDASAKMAGLASRINTLLSIPMLFAMVATTHLYGG